MPGQIATGPWLFSLEVKPHLAEGFMMPSAGGGDDRL